MGMLNTVGMLCDDVDFRRLHWYSVIMRLLWNSPTNIPRYEVFCAGVVLRDMIMSFIFRHCKC
jgi:hypothetical protein